MEQQSNTQVNRMNSEVQTKENATTPPRPSDERRVGDVNPVVILTHPTHE